MGSDFNGNLGRQTCNLAVTGQRDDDNKPKQTASVPTYQIKENTMLIGLIIAFAETMSHIFGG
ncbi:hypothetical protein [Herbaspirillum sp.]|uniref:hypothetical protein n=1 Tax=Herbaspirillum sp. TaxID=1890675 RepID=UPI0031D69A84